MYIASITVYCDEGFRLESWIDFFSEYSAEIYKHIIINNGKEEDNLLLKNKFPNSNIIFTKNKALTAAYNIGIRLALSDSKVDSIMLIGNDMKLPKGNTTKLFNFLYSNKKFGMVAPILLFKDNEITEAYGARVEPNHLTFTHLYRGVPLNDIKDDIIITDSVPGGMNISKRNYYEQVGLQDENLFMYSDEIDTAIRAKKKGFILAATKNIIAWHQHVNLNKSDAKSPLSGYLMGRNEIYLAHKHYGNKEILSAFIVRLGKSVRFLGSALIKRKSTPQLKFSWFYFKGVIAGLLNNMKINNKLIQ